MQDRRGLKARRRWRVMAMLVLVYTLNFVDRQIVGILAVPIKAELGLSDTQLGLMGGLAFALFYTALGIPVAVWADRGNRTWIMTLALTVWSAMTALCGLAQNFWQLFLARMGVGVGEAGGVAPAYSLIADYFPARERARALAIYSFGIPIGSALGIGLGGIIASQVDWRFAFVVVGVAGVLLAPLFKRVVKEPPRGALDPGATVLPATFGQTVSALAAKPSFWLISLGAACSSMIGYALFFWLPSLFVRSFGLSILDASLFYAAVLLVGGIAGIWLGGVLADRLGESRRAAYALIPAAAFLVCAPLYGLAIVSEALPVVFLLMLIPTALSLAWLGPVLSTIQHLVAAGMRATASAIFLFVINLVGLGVGTWLIGAGSDYLQQQFGAESLRYSILAGTIFYLAASLFFLLAAGHLKRDWHEPARD